MFEIVKNINKIINFVDKKNLTKFWLINLFFLVNAFFQLLFIFTFYLLVQSFSDPLKLSDNKILIFISKLIGLDHNLVTSNNFLILIFTIVVIFSNLFFISSNLFKFNFSYNLLTNLRSKLYNYYLGKNFEQFIKKNNAEYLTDILSDSERFAMQVVGNFLNISLASITLIIILVPVFALNFQVSLIIFLILLMIFYLAGKNLKPILTQFGKKIKIFSKNRYEIINDSLRNFNEIKLENLRSFFEEKYYVKENEINKISKILSIINHSSKPIIEIFLILIFYLSFKFFLESSLIFTQYIDVVAVIIITLYKLLPSINSMYQSINEINYHKVVINHFLKNLKDMESKNKLIKTDIVPQKINKIEFKDISFFYDGKKSFRINKLNFVLKKNEIMGIDGVSGSGKTTILNILSGLLRPKSGKIIINKKKINIFNNSQWFKKISYVSQNVNIFNDTIHKNISYNLGANKTKSNLKKTISILNNLNLKEFVKRNKKLDELGKTISGGQLQRIAIARALFKNSDIIIFDEPTRNLDFKNEKLLLNQIKFLKKDKIIIFISHNKKNLGICDKTIKLKLSK